MDKSNKKDWFKPQIEKIKIINTLGGAGNTAESVYTRASTGIS